MTAKDDDVINILPEEFIPKMKTEALFIILKPLIIEVFGDQDLRNEDYTTKEAPKINYQFNNGETS